MFVCAQKVTAGEEFYGLFIFVLVLEQVVGLILFKRQCGLLILKEALGAKRRDYFAKAAQNQPHQ
jgi:hypothetical protein